MKTAFLPGAVLVLALALGGCATRGGAGADATGGVQVARFHLDQQIARAQIAVQAFDQADANRPDFPAYAAAVSRELTRLGWTVVPSTAQPEQIALIDVEQGSREAIAALSAARIGRGIAGGGFEGSAADFTATLLEVRIRRRSDATVFWEGRAVTEARTGSPEAQRAAAVDRLAEALFRDFPGESGRTIRLR